MAETIETTPAIEEEDEFDRLRRKSTRAEDIYDELDSPSSGGRGGMTPIQWLIIAVLVLLNVIALGVGMTLIL